MASYKQASITGEIWHRFSRVVIDNPRAGGPSVLCVEQEVISLASGEIVRDVGNLNFQFDQNFTFEVINPLTGVSTGTFANGGAAFSLVYSYVMAVAAKRDAAIVAAAAIKPADNMGAA